MNGKKETIESVMKEKVEIKPCQEFSKNAHIGSLKEYNKIYKESIENPEKFWGEKAEQLDWFRKWDKVYFWDKKNLKCEWFSGGKLNVSYNCLDRHLKKNKDKAAIIWESEQGDTVKYTYGQLYHEVCKFANVLKKKGVKKGDIVCIYLPMIPELAIAMLACTRIGAIHSIVFGGFSAEALKDRILDSQAKVLVTSDGSYRRGTVIQLKQSSDEAVKDCSCIKAVIVCKRAHNEVEMKDGRDSFWEDEMNADDITDKCEPEHMGAEEPLFILYTSGTTGKPKGVLHTTAGYLIYVYQTFKWIFDIKDKDIYWCTADIGWITGHSYIVYGPLADCATSLMFEGAPDYPKPNRWWEIVEKHKVTVFYTAPTAIRVLIRYGDEWPKKCNLSSLRLLGSVGEPINPEVWLWYHKHIGNGKCPIVDTWWQTETGGILITPLPGAMTLKPGSASRPFPGVVAEVWREDGTKANVNENGYLVIKQPWPGMFRTLYNNPEKYRETYFSKFPGLYLTGDGARIDGDGDFWLMGRLDDIIKISGHRIGTAEVESALVSHKAVAEAAVVPIPNKIKGQVIYAFVTLHTGFEKTEELRQELIKHVAKEIGPIAKPEAIQFADALPETRSGKIMRRILKAIAEGRTDVGNITTLADPSVVDILIKERL